MGDFIIQSDGDGRLSDFLWKNYNVLALMPRKPFLPAPEENHVVIRGHLRRAIANDGFVSVSLPLFKPHFGLQMVLMLARKGDYVRIYFLVYQEGVAVSAVGYREKHIRELEGND